MSYKYMLLDSRGAVSYTHLDVYKRQVLYDHHAGNVGREPPEHVQRGLCAACGGAQTNDGLLRRPIAAKT